MAETVAQQVQGWLGSLTQRFGVAGETGQDIAVPYDTPIYALAPGTVVGAGYYGGGGVTSIASPVQTPGLVGRASVYYQHLSTVLTHVGESIQAGQLIGYSGGQLGYGNHPASPQYSTGPHIEVGLNAPYGGMWAPMGANINPLPWLKSIAAGQQGGSAVTSGAGSGGGPTIPLLSGIAGTVGGFFAGVGDVPGAIQSATEAAITTAAAALKRVGLMVLALALIGIGAGLLLWDPLSKAAGTVAKAAPLALA